MSKTAFTTLLLLSLSFSFVSAQKPQKEPVNKETKEKILDNLKSSAGKIWFQENKGQMPSNVLYSFSTNFGAVYIEENAIVLKATKYHEPDEDPATPYQDSAYVESQWIRLTFEGGAEKFQVEPKGVLVSNINYFTSPTPENFVYGVKAYSELLIRDVYPGVDLRLYSVAKGQMEFDWILQRGADCGQIRMKAEGHEGIVLTENGGFGFKCRFENLQFHMPESYQIVNGEKKNLNMKYAQSGNTLFFESNPEIRPELPLVIDPTVMWATYMEETGGDYLFASESDNCGRVYLAGRSKAAANTTYIQGATGYDVSFNSGDVPILYIFSADGDSIKAFTYLGSDATPADMDLFPNGRVLVAGSMRGKSGSGVGSIPATVNGGSGSSATFASYSTSATLTGRGWLAILSPELNHLFYTSHMPGTNGTFGGFDEKGVTCVEIVDNNTYYVAGVTDVAVSSGTGTTFVNSSSTPDATFARGEGYICRFSGAGYNTWDWGTYVGGSDDEILLSIKLSSDNTKLAFAGNFIDDNVASGTGFPALVNAVDALPQASEGFFGWLPQQATNPGSFGMLSYIGGPGEEGDVLVESMAHNIYVLGYTNSTSFPGITGVTGHTAYQANNKGDYDAFISKCAFSGSAHAGGINGGAFKSTFFGGSGTELSGGIIFNTNDSNIYLFITTGSASVAQVGANGYPTVNTVPPSNFYDGNHDRPTSSTWTPQTNNGIAQNADISFVTLNQNLTQNLYTSYCGGSQRDYLGNTGRLNGAGHYGFNRVTNIYSLGTTIHSNDLAARGSQVFSNLSFDSAVGTGDDHFIVKFNLSNTDMGDAPASYDDADPARHGTNSLGLTVSKFGAALTDYDSEPESSIQADGDDNRNTGPAVCQPLLDDEDGLISVPVITVETTGNVNVPVYLANASGATNNVYAWIDFDGDGVFEVGEAANAATIANRAFLTGVTFANSGTTITATRTAHGLAVNSIIGIEGCEGNLSVLNGIWTVTAVTANTFQFTVNTAPAGAITGVSRVVQTLTRTNLVFNFATGKACPSQVKSGRTYLRMRITADALADNAGTPNLDERSRGVANTGEIEDHVVYIRGRDYGDLPASYGNASAMVFNDINVNYIPEDTGAVWLGTLVDIETDCAANNSTLANGDDLENDDEDGVTIPSGSKKAGSTFNIDLSISRTAGFIPAIRAHYGLWIDWNADGDFTDASDGFYNGSTTGTSVSVSVTAPLGANFNPNFAVRAMVGRQAFTSGNYNLVYNNGEIEDYINDPGILISGNVFDDGDGTYDAAGVDFNPGSVINRPSGTQLWAYLINPAGTQIVDSIAVLNNGSYYLQGALASTNGYEVRISTTRAAIGAAPPAVALPTNWVSVGEDYGVNNVGQTGIEALTPASNSRIAVNTGTNPVTDVNFGINLRPESFDTTAASQVNLGGTETYPIPGLRGFDLEQGMFFGSQSRTMIIESLPANANLYYDSDGPGGNPPFQVVAGQVINNYVASNLRVDPLFSGSGTVTFTYAWRDSAQFKDLSPATVTLPFAALSISGTVYQDPDGTTDNDVDGTARGVFAGSPLYAYLINASNVIEDAKTVNSNGTFSFNTANSNTSYKVLVTSQSLSIGNSAPGSSTLPANFLHVGEDYGSNNSFGSGVVTSGWNGFIDVTTGTSDVTGVDFGIEYGTYAHDKTYYVDPDDITGLTSQTPYTKWLPLYDASGTTDTTFDSVSGMPGKVSGYDLEDGRFDGLTGNAISGSVQKFILNTLPPAGNGQLRYGSIDLIPSPTVSDPSWIYWNQTLSRYEIPNFNPSSLKMTLVFAYQSSTSFTYSYADAAGVGGRIATYTINYTVPLPLAVSALICDTRNSRTDLKWTVYDPRELAAMKVMRSADGRSYAEIAAITEFNRNLDRQEFRYTDYSAEAGPRYYRIDLVSNDAKRISSDVCYNNVSYAVADVQINLMPNPTENDATLSIRTPSAESFSIEVFGPDGRRLSAQTTQVADFYSVSLKTNQYPSGVYTVKVSWNGQTEVIKLMKL